MGMHLGFWSWWPFPADAPGTIRELFPDMPQYPELAPLIWWGWVGVEIFFVVSGFVIARSARSSSPHRFARARILRLYPGAWVCALFSFVIISFVSGFSLSNLTRLINTLALSPFPHWLDGVYWTLPVECAFYGLIFLVMRVRGAGAVRYVQYILGAVSTLFLLGLLIGVLPSRWLTTILLLRHGVFFALGMWLADRTEKKPTPSSSRLFGVILILMGCMEIAYTSHQKALALEIASNALMYWSGMGAAIGVWLLSLVGIAPSILLGHRPNIDAPASHSWVRLFGLATYPLYLLHQTVGGAILFAASSVTSASSALLIACLSSILISLIVAQYAEPAVRHRCALILDRLPVLRHNGLALKDGS